MQYNKTPEIVGKADEFQTKEFEDLTTRTTESETAVELHSSQTQKSLDSITLIAMTEIPLKDISGSERYKFTIALDVFFNTDRDATRFEFEVVSREKMGITEIDEWRAQCYREVRQQLSFDTVALTWWKSWVTEPGCEQRVLITYLPTLHFGPHRSKSCFV